MGIAEELEYLCTTYHSTYILIQLRRSIHFADTKVDFSIIGKCHDWETFRISG